MDLMGLVLQDKVTKNSGRKCFSNLIQSVTDWFRVAARSNSKEALASQLDEVAPSQSWPVSLQCPRREGSVVWQAGADLGPGEDTVPHKEVKASGRLPSRGGSSGRQAREKEEEGVWMSLKVLAGAEAEGCRTLTLRNQA